MVVNTHLDALDECLASSAISAESKEHLRAIRDQLAKAKVSRKPTKQQIANREMRSALEAEVAFDKDYSLAELTAFLWDKGFDASLHRTAGIISEMGMKKQSTVFTDASGKKLSVYRRS